MSDRRAFATSPVIDLTRLRERFSSTAVAILGRHFGLSPFERDVLLLAAGAEVDPDIAAMCRTVSGKGPTFAVATSLLADAHWSAISPGAPLRRWRLVELEGTGPIVDRTLRIDERVLHSLQGVNDLDVRLQSYLRRAESPSLMAAAHEAVAQSTIVAVRLGPDEPPVIQLSGDDESGQMDVAASIAEGLDLRCYRVRVRDLPTSAAELDAWCVLWSRETVLLPAALAIENSPEDPPHAAARVAERTAGLRILTGRQPDSLDAPVLQFTVDRPGPADQRRLWHEAMGTAGSTDGDVPALVWQCRLNARAVEAVRDEVDWVGPGEGNLLAAVRRVCRSRSQALLDLAERIRPSATWDDLVLPPAQLDVLRQIAHQVRQRPRVYDTWGFAGRSNRGLGVSALFAGESGTGKSHAAEVLASSGELGIDLFRIDLAQVVSKYIGETEKNLRRVFDAAEDSGAILLFDEADGLFNKRVEVKDSHDLYATQTIAFLLQKMESYRGLAILTTNQKASLDIAFQRRLRFIVQFPFPTLEQRELIWRRALPPDAPVDSIAFEKLARLHVSGGQIRNIALNAAFLASAAGTSIRMGHLRRAAELEAAKQERTVSETEVRDWV